MYYIILIYLITTAIAIPLGLFKLFPKAGEASWKAFIPFYNFWIIQKITGKPKYWVFGTIFPGVGLIIIWGMLAGLYKSFGVNSTKNIALGILAPIYLLPKLGFDPNTTYIPIENLPKKEKVWWKEWGEAALFAIVVATIVKGYTYEPYQIPSSSMEESMLIGDFLFVSKFNYGIRLPNTPFTIPFTHNKWADLPLKGLPLSKTYSDRPHIPYTRFPAISKPKNGDIMVFNFPEADTVINTPEMFAMSYNNFIRQNADFEYHKRTDKSQPYQVFENQVRKAILANPTDYPLVTRPVDKRENFVKRCVGIAGNILEIKDGILFINGIEEANNENHEFHYNVIINAEPDRNAMLRIGITPEDLLEGVNANFRNLNLPQRKYTLTSTQAEKLKSFHGIVSVNRAIYEIDSSSHVVFPHDGRGWTIDNMGPITIPKKGESIVLNAENLPIYKRAITIYEGNELAINDGKIFINGIETNSYTFKMDYYWLMGDNRHNSLDSRYWGFVPEDHVVGKAAMIWFSTDANKKGNLFQKIRWNRIFTML